MLQSCALHIWWPAWGLLPRKGSTQVETAACQWRSNALSSARAPTSTACAARPCCWRRCGTIPMWHACWEPACCLPVGLRASRQYVLAGQALGAGGG